MKRVILIGLQVVALCGALFSYSCRDTKAMRAMINDKILVSPQEYDLKELGSDTDTISCYFQIKNATDSILVIDRVLVSCNCLSVQEFTQKPLAKGETGFIKVTLDTHKVSGKFRKNIYAKTNQGCTPLLRLKGMVRE